MALDLMQEFTKKCPAKTMGLSGPATSILFLLCWHANNKTHGGAYPGKARLSVESGFSESTVKRSLRELEAKGLIKALSHRNGGDGMATEWKIDLSGAPSVNHAEFPKRKPRLRCIYCLGDRCDGEKHDKARIFDYQMKKLEEFELLFEVVDHCLEEGRTFKKSAFPALLRICEKWDRSSFEFEESRERGRVYRKSADLDSHLEGGQADPPPGEKGVTVLTIEREGGQADPPTVKDNLKGKETLKGKYNKAELCPAHETTTSFSSSTIEMVIKEKEVQAVGADGNDNAGGFW